MIALYRAVGPSELADLFVTRRYRVSPAGAEGKYFFLTALQAANFARMVGGGPYSTTSVLVPREDLAKAHFIVPAGEGPGWVFTTQDVPAAACPFATGRS